ncbi:MAG: hypothetical protein U9R79_02805 [Armatimonadota bacterium]|nr:hypothetical protein [Armatimonadota bacterium]
MRPQQIPDLASLTPVTLSQEFEQALREQGVPGEKVEAAVTQFQQYPRELQQSMLLTVKGTYAEALDRPELSIARIDPDLLRRVHDFVLFRVSSFWPGQGYPGIWAYAMGNGFHGNCTVYFDGSPVQTHYWGPDLEFFPNSLCFKVPDNAAIPQMHDVYVRDTEAAKNTPTLQYEVIAPRGYRGYHGWKFPNFSRATIDWKLYAHYFGASNVEYADGTHRPAAQQWFDNAYTSAGAGGNCYGMSVSSLRLRNGEHDHMYHAIHFTSPATHQPWVWWYDWNDTTRETVQQQQGGWYTQEVLDTHNALINSQDARAVFTRCEQLCNQTANRPVLIVWGNGWGHAVVPYDTQVDGNTRRILHYDNNDPYAQNETDGPDPSVATVNWSQNTFSYGGGPTGVAMSYEECTPPNPHLPGAEYGGPGADTVVVVASDETEVQQITDEGGRRFFNPNRSVNTDPNTRIPNSSIVYPLVQRPPVILRQQPRLRLQGPALQAPGEQTLIFVFGQAQNKSLTFDINSNGLGQLSYFEPGQIFALQSQGAGQVQFSGLLQLPAVQVANPQGLQVNLVRFIRSTAAGDRLFELRNMQNLGAQPLQLIPDAQGLEVQVIGAPGLQFDLNLQGPIGRGMQQGAFGGIGLQAGAAAVLRPTNWQRLGTSNLRLQLLNLQNNQVMQQQIIQRLQ